MKIVNLTPHALNVCDKDGLSVEIKPSGTVARVATKREVVAEINGIEVFRTQFGEVENMPDEQDGVVYVVSAIVLNALGGRYDVFCPGEAIRNESGQVVGCRGLSQ